MGGGMQSVHKVIDNKNALFVAIRVFLRPLWNELHAD
jgi:hypothetical protein